MNAIYCRQSLDKRDSLSIDTQIDFCKRQLENPEQSKTYIDRGYSGKNTKRPEFEKMIADIRLGIIKKVIVYRLDRISRSMLDFTNMMDMFRKRDVEFTSATEQFDTSTPMGKAMLSIIMIFAELERSTVQLRVIDNYYERGKKGFFMGGTVPYGFNNVRTTIDGRKTSMLEEDVEQSSILEKMYDMYALSDMSLGKVSDYLNENNIPAAKGGKWDSGKVSRYLRSPAYVKADADVYQYYKNKGCKITNDLSDFIGVNGCFLYGKREANERKYTDVNDHTLSLGIHNGFIDSNVWLLCQYKLDSNKQIKNSGKGKYTWLSGLAKCGHCGYAVSVINTNEGKYQYFNCRGKTNLKICDGHSEVIHVEDVEYHVEKEIINRVEELKNVKYEVKTQGDAKENELKIKVMKIDEQIENLVNQIADANNVVMTYINQRIESLDNVKKGLLEELRKTTVQKTQNQPLEIIFKNVDKWDTLDMQDKKETARALLNKVLVFDDYIKYDWKILKN